MSRDTVVHRPVLVTITGRLDPQAWPYLGQFNRDALAELVRCLGIADAELTISTQEER
ncbi:MAG: hypothetical protein NUW01_01665 [Gemmatimonadaceae bacterium]|nr:hypothetical protein [Gemmatimonadaceae bacterium]